MGCSIGCPNPISVFDEEDDELGRAKGVGITHPAWMRDQLDEEVVVLLSPVEGGTTADSCHRRSNPVPAKRGRRRLQTITNVSVSSMKSLLLIILYAASTTPEHKRHQDLCGWLRIQWQPQGVCKSSQGPSQSAIRTQRSYVFARKAAHNGPRGSRSLLSQPVACSVSQLWRPGRARGAASVEPCATSQWKPSGNEPSIHTAKIQIVQPPFESQKCRLQGEQA